MSLDARRISPFSASAPADGSWRRGGKQCPLRGIPVPGVDFDETDIPVVVVDEEVIDCVHSMPYDGFHAAEMRIVGFGLVKGGATGTGCGRRMMERRTGLYLPRCRQVAIEMVAILDLLHDQVTQITVARGRDISGRTQARAHRG